LQIGCTRIALDDRPRKAALRSGTTGAWFVIDDADSSCRFERVGEIPEEGVEHVPWQAGRLVVAPDRDDVAKPFTSHATVDGREHFLLHVLGEHFPASPLLRIDALRQADREPA